MKMIKLKKKNKTVRLIVLEKKKTKVIIRLFLKIVKKVLLKITKINERIEIIFIIEFISFNYGLIV